jgi:hypothetical protein
MVSSGVRGRLGSVGLGLEFLWGQVVEGGVQVFGVVPADPLDDGTFYLVSIPPGSLVLDQLSVEQVADSAAQFVAEVRSSSR